ncbi:MAG: amidohydrolase family protein, partial [Gemmatimonadaceae bacterium]|nr:amidohydrolase family protein [Gemmatimonadaceae bacterium]
PAEKVTVEQALVAYTRDAAYAEFQDGEKGVLSRGRLADLVLIDRDLTRIAPETIRDARVTLTIVGGRIVHDVR